MKDNGKIIRWKDMVYSHGQMEEGMKENISMIKKKDKEFFIGKILLYNVQKIRPDGRKYEGEWYNGK
jgi:hypothetical protein